QSLRRQLEDRRHRGSAGDYQNPQTSRPTDPRPAACVAASSRFIPNDVSSRKPLANASRLEEPFARVTTATAPTLARASLEFSSKKKRIDNSPDPALWLWPEKKWFKFPIHAPSVLAERDDQG